MTRSDPKSLTAAFPTMQSFIPALSRMPAGTKGDVLAGWWGSALIGRDIFEGWQELRMEDIALETGG